MLKVLLQLILMRIFVSQMQQATNDIALRNLCEQLQMENAVLKQELAQLKKIIFGSKHERFIPTDPKAPTQLELGVVAETVSAVKITDTKRSPIQKLLQQQRPLNYILAVIHYQRI